MQIMPFKIVECSLPCCTNPILHRYRMSSEHLNEANILFFCQQHKHGKVHIQKQKVGHHCFFSPSFWSNRIPWSAIELANWRSLWAFYWFYFRISVSHDSFNRSFHSIPVPFRLNDFNCKIHTRKMNKFECVHARGTPKTSEPLNQQIRLPK